MIQIRKQEICIISIWQFPLTSYPHRKKKLKKKKQVLMLGGKKTKNKKTLALKPLFFEYYFTFKAACF